MKINFSIKDILKGKFLVKKNAYRSWTFIIFITILSLISITSSHIMDRKIKKITKLSEEIKELKSEYADIHSQYLKMKLSSVLNKLVNINGLKHLEEPPYELILEKKTKTKDIDTILE
ncbi:FtsL-like putative cell division protein [Blattabacterium cuenoti]|uniref:FtsL-like putative cell division protein n=1 Tax=Blattabacterium cuenoti TaxID=1653831 RepID=UPI00163C7006|nr:FtsL-like putative cell division protein [Blattabacterium cuenoti]